MTKTLEEKLTDTLIEKLASGAIEEVVQKHLSKAIDEAASNVFSNYGGGLGKVIEEKLRETMVPAIEKYDFAEYGIKLTAVLDELVQQVATPNKELLEKFSKFINVPDDKISFTSLAEAYADYVADTFDTVDREIEHDSDEPAYVPVTVEVRFEQDSSYLWSNSEYGNLVFEVTDGIENEEELKKLNFFVPIWKISSKWRIRSLGEIKLSELRWLSDFEVLLRTLNQYSTKIELDTEYYDSEVYSKTTPEYTLE